MRKSCLGIVGYRKAAREDFLRARKKRKRRVTDSLGFELFIWSGRLLLSSQGEPLHP